MANAITPLPQFRRPTRADAIEIATTLFVNGERVDMNGVCAALGIGRTTLHRWIGDRDSLLSEVLAGLTDLVWKQVTAEAEGEGRERALHAGRRFMEITAAFPPLRRFVEREPQLALRILLAGDGLVAGRIRAGFRGAFLRHAPETEISDELIDVAVQAGTALLWAPVTIGGEPEIARAGLLIRAVLDRAAAS